MLLYKIIKKKSTLNNKNKLNNISFLTSIDNVYNFPINNIFEIVFLGRSNVGKSSIINKIFTKKIIVHASKNPGKTKLINFFKINSLHRIVDLPGYGYAKHHDLNILRLNFLLKNYVKTRKHVKIFFLSIDSKNLISYLDIYIIQLISKHQKNIHILFTKSDKLLSKQFNEYYTYAYKILKKYDKISFQFFSIYNKKTIQTLKNKINFLIKKN